MSSFFVYKTASFRGLPTIQFLITCSMQKLRGKVFYDVNGINVSLSRQRVGEVQTTLRPFLVAAIQALES